MEGRRLDPVDLMMRGRMDEAAEMYLDVYGDVAGDAFIGPHMLSQLHICVAWMDPDLISPEDATDKVEEIVFRNLRERGIDVNEQYVKEDIYMAKDILVSSRKRLEKTLGRKIRAKNGKRKTD